MAYSSDVDSPVGANRAPRPVSLRRPTAGLCNYVIVTLVQAKFSPAFPQCAHVLFAGLMARGFGPFAGDSLHEIDGVVVVFGDLFGVLAGVDSFADGVEL